MRREARSARSAPLLTQPLVAAMLIVAVAIATRCVTYGNPIVDMDDQFYWMVGRSMWNGDWPVLDIWDRKPVGLFLIFGAIAGVSSSIIAMQLVATLFAAATAWIVRAAALTFTGAQGATFAALAYLLVLPAFGGQAGQSPVFYNLFMAGAGALLFRASGHESARAIRRDAYWAMLLCGLALIVKQVSIIEGAYFGLAFLWLLRRRDEPTRRIVGAGALMIGIALLPTLATFVGYALAGTDAVVAYGYAAYGSIFAKSSIAVGSRLAGIGYLLLFMLPLLVFAALGAVTRHQSGVHPPRQWLILGWIIAAVGGYLLIPNFFPHYALPIAVPLAISAASAFDRPGGLLLMTATAAFAISMGTVTQLTPNKMARRDFAAIVRQVDVARQDGCLYIVNGPVALYAEVPACRLTPYLFPYHLTLATETGAVGIDQRTEVSRILDLRPAIIVTQDKERPNHAPTLDKLIDARLATDYLLVLRVAEKAHPAISTLRIWQRKDLRTRQR